MGVYIEYEKAKEVELCQDCTEEIAESTYGWLQQINIKKEKKIRIVIHFHFVCSNKTTFHGL